MIDEAHNVCPAEPEDPLTALATDTAVRIAAEGRKFGLYLLTSTQRPQKAHPNVVSQCDNLVLMRMNSAADLAYLRDVFSFVPERPAGPRGHLRARAGAGGGQALQPPGDRQDGSANRPGGGADVPSTWARVS